MRIALFFLVGSIVQVTSAYADPSKVCEAVHLKDRDGKIETFRPDAPFERIWLEKDIFALPVEVESSDAGRFTIVVNGEELQIRRRNIVFAPNTPCSAKPICQLARRASTSTAALGSDTCAR